MNQPAGQISFRNSQGLEASGTLLHLTRNQVVFEVYNPYSVVQLSEVLDQMRIVRGERAIYQGRAVVSNLVNTGIMLIVTATLVDPWADLSDLPQGADLSDEIATFLSDWQRGYGELDVHYKDAVVSFRNFLEELNRWLDQGEAIAAIADPNPPEQRVQEFVGEVHDNIRPQLQEMLQGFEAVASAIPDPALPVHKAFARRQLHPVILCSPFLHRTYTKPLGYAGDYEMVNMIFGEAATGGTTYAKIVNILNLDTPPAQAHRNRIAILQRRLAEMAAVERGRPLRILNVGCGPAIEIQRFAREPNCHRCDFTLLDFNAETLAYAERRIEAAMSESGRRFPYRTVHKSIHDLLREAARGSPAGYATYDFIYCAGLFDYLSDKICSRLLRLFLSWLDPGGRVLATNVHSDNPVKHYMDHVVEWHLIYRNEADFERIAPSGAPRRTYTDDTGINVFLEFDAAESQA